MVGLFKRHSIKITTTQGYLKTRIYAMGAQINERECKKLRDSQGNNERTYDYSFVFHPVYERVKDERPCSDQISPR